MARKEVKFKFKDVEYVMHVKEKHFCLHYVQNNCNGTKAAIKAGYAEASAVVTASKLLSKTNISAYVEALRNDIETALNISAVGIARELKRIGFSDIRKIFDEAGNVIQVPEFDDDAAANVSGVEVFEAFADGEYIGRTKKVTFYNKPDALTKLARMIGKDGVKKVATVDSTGKDVQPAPAVQVIHIDANSLTDEQLEKIINDNEIKK